MHAYMASASLALYSLHVVSSTAGAVAAPPAPAPAPAAPSPVPSEGRGVPAGVVPVEDAAGAGAPGSAAPREHTRNQPWVLGISAGRHRSMATISREIQVKHMDQS